MDTDHTMTAVYGATPTFVLTVASTNPTTGVPITLSVNDVNGVGSGTTQFTRTYKQSQQVTLTAPINGGGNSYFLKWQRDGFDHSSFRTTTVFMNSNQTMTAVYVTIPPPTPTPTPTPTGQSVTYQIDPAHSGSQVDSITPPLMQRWSRDLGSPTSYPLIAGGKVFVVAGTNLYALNSATGATVWGPINLGVYPNIAYDSGRVFGVNRDGLLRSFDAATGTEQWSRQLTGQQFTSPPSAMDGTVYVSGWQTLYGVNETDGTIKWGVLGAGGDHSSPAVTSSAVYVSYACNQAYSLTPSTGAIIWHHTSSCFGGGGKTAVFHSGRVYVRGSLGNFALDQGTGIEVGQFVSVTAPAFHGSTGFYLNAATIEARDISTGTLKWSFTGDGNIRSAPIVVNGTVYVGSVSGKLYGLDETTGANVWTGTVGASVNPPDEHNSSVPLTGLGAGEGLIVVPASNLVVAYQAASVTTPPIIYAEEGTNNAATVDSVTFVRGPFRKTNPNNFSVDQRTRLILLTSNLGLAQSDLADPAVLVVEAGGVNLPVENVGTISIPGLGTSYIVVRLPDNVPTGVIEVRVKLRGAASDPRLLNISP